MPESQKYGGFESGLRTTGGKAKPALDGFRLPLVAKKTKGSTKVSLWGLARPAKGATKVIVEQRDGSASWKTNKTVTTDSHGYWTSSASPRRRQARVARAVDRRPRQAVDRSGDARARLSRRR